METALDIFRLMMRDEIAPELRRMGFKGSGQSFRLPSETHWVLLGIQKSGHSYPGLVRFTVNVMVVSKRTWTEARSERSYVPEQPSANTMWGPWLWQQRIGHLLPGRSDKWWEVDDRRSAEVAKREVLEGIRDCVLPAIQQQLTPEAGGS